MSTSSLRVLSLAALAALACGAPRLGTQWRSVKMAHCTGGYALVE